MKVSFEGAGEMLLSFLNASGDSATCASGYATLKLQSEKRGNPWFR